MREPHYPDAPRSSTFQDGLEFQDFVCEQLARQHIVLQNLSSKRYQFEVGENLQGFEIKFDGRCSDTGRLSIEIAEKASATNVAWIPSGIYRDDNSWLYIQGNYSVLFLFAKNWLRRYYESKRPGTHDSHGTVRKFYLPLMLARECAVKVFDFTENSKEATA